MDPITLTLYIAYFMVAVFVLTTSLIVFYSEYQKRSHPRAKHA